MFLYSGVLNENEKCAVVVWVFEFPLPVKQENFQVRRQLVVILISLETKSDSVHDKGQRQDSDSTPFTLHQSKF